MTVADLLEAAAARWPDAAAVEAAGRPLTYAELDARAEGVAGHLRSLGVGPDVRVGVRIGRSLELAVALWGVLKAGGACVPLDPSYPDERLRFMEDDAGLATVLTGADVPAAAAAGGAARATGPDHVGYVIYTSGSTGQAKGVLLTHRGLVNHHRAVVDLYELGPGDRVLQFCSLGFDASIEEMFPSWAAGATVVFRPEDVPLLGRGWLAWLRAQRITVANLPTAYWHAWVGDLESLGEKVPDDLRLVVVGGGKARAATCRAWRRLGGDRPRWINAYGPTETTCMSTWWEAPSGWDAADDPPIGRPLPDTTVHVVDGELLIGGAGVARGYLNRPELTAERFVDGPDGERVYRTGDLVRLLDSGDLDFLGRLDDQVKIRGFRVEPGEVEAALVAHPGVRAAAVVADDDRLVAYVVGDAAAGDLRRFLAERLPAHLVPATFTALDALPLTAHGKVDMAGLPAPEQAGTGGPTRSPGEARMADIWARVLGLDVAAVGPDDDFFDLGGHSLLATQVVAQVREAFGTQTPLRAIFEAPTVARLAAVVEAEARAGGAAPGPALVSHRRAPGSRFPLSIAQEQMWALERAADPPGLYNVTALHTFDGPVGVAGLRAAAAHVVGRHEILRAGIEVDPDGRPHHVLAAAVDVDLTVIDAPGDVDRLVAEQDARPFDLSQPPLFRLGVFGARLALTADHLICDGPGIAILMAELRAAYEDRADGLPPLPVQFADFVAWQRSHATDDVLRRQLDWWVRTLDGMPLGPAVPYDHVPASPTRRIRSRAVEVGEAARARLDEVARATGSTVFTVTAAVAAVLFGRHGGLDDVAMSTTLSGRTRAEAEDLVGMFSGIGRLRTDLSGDPPFAEVVVRARDRVLGMFENQDVPFMRVRRALWPDFPAGGPGLFAALPVEFQYFHVRDHQELYFRGQLHPLSLTLLDDGRRLTGGISYKLDFYEPSTVERLAADLEGLLDAVGADPSLRLSELPVNPSTA